MKYCLLLIALCLTGAAFAQNNSALKTEPYSKEWRRADSLLDQGLPQSALPLIQSVNAKAKAGNQPVQLLKAQLYLLRAAQDGDGADTATIHKAEAEAATAPFPGNAIWHSITAQLYWNYYQQNRYRILGRTALAGAAAKDVQEWDAPQFFRVIAQHYRQSIRNEDGLAGVPVASYEPVIAAGNNTRKLRPTLYDLLAFRALAFFENDEKDVPQPADRFELDDPKLLAPAEDFIKLKVITNDSASSQAQALRIYQRILATHMSDARPDAFIDADLQRIEFVYRNAVFGEKKKAYEAALSNLYMWNSNNPAAAEVWYRRLVSEMNVSEETSDGDDPSDQDNQSEKSQNFVGKKAKRFLPGVLSNLTAIAAQFPGSEGGVHAAQLIQTIEAKSLSLTSEETVLPNEASRILVRYKNVGKAYIRVVKVDAEKFRQQQRQERETFYKTLLATASAQSFSAELPATSDYESHSTEVKIDALPLGAYAIIISARSDFSAKDNALSYALVQCTNIAMIKAQGDGKKRLTGFVVSRKTGAALPNVTLSYYREVYNSKTRSYDYTTGAEATSAADGSFKIPKSDQTYYGYSARAGDDRYFSTEYFYSNDYERSKPVATTRTFFFTDRSIYRPGQTVYYKGIIVKTAADQKTSSVVPQSPTTVTFYDVNGQKIAAQDLKSNEFGSFTGSFVAPQGVLTGSMSIRNENGSESFSVEEYKRPKFAVSFDTLKGAYSLNERVTIKGFAKAYAGNNVDGADVKYTVRRQARWPFWYDWWRPMPSSSAQEISHGNATTGADGSFTISFLTQPDKSLDTATLPVFTYSIHVDVTDAAGETRSGDESLTAGYRSLQISASIPEKATLKSLDTLTVSTTNLNGVFVPAKATVRITALNEPRFTPRARLWPMPDQYTIDEATFRKYFPLDEYKRESKPQSWATGAPNWVHDFTTTREGEVVIPKGTLRSNGWYLIDITTKDKDGKPVRQKHYVELYDPALEGRPVTALSTFGDDRPHQPGETVKVQAVTSFTDLHLIQDVTDMSSGDVLSQADVKNGIHNWSKALTEADRGGLALQWITVKDNRVYTASENITVPWSNKDLQVSWETHRDKLQPGAKETWTMKVSGPKKEKVAAEMVAGLYDASLDAFKPHGWGIYGLWPSLYRTLSFNAGAGFSQIGGTGISGFDVNYVADYDKRYDGLIGFSNNEAYTLAPGFSRRSFSIGGGRTIGRDIIVDGVQYDAGALGTTTMPPAAMAEMSVRREKKKESDLSLKINLGNRSFVAASDKAATEADANQDHQKDIPVRKNLQETAFFQPQLKTDADGNIRIEFTMPEALTEWKFMALAHTKDMQVGQLSGSIKTQKDLMVQPGLPRFFRQGDDMVIATKIANLSKGSLTGTAHLEIVDAATGKALNTQFRLTSADVALSVKEGQSTSATWTIHIPQSGYEPVAVRITASAGAFTDGEENILPVLTNRTLVTETMPLWINGSGSKTFNFEKLAKSGDSKTLSQYGLTLEYTPNPAWYAVQALPYLMEYPYECAEQTFNRYYANALASHIIDVAPRVKEIFRKWEGEDTAALQSNLEKNEELKSALLEETPWVLEAKNENEQKHRIAMLFQSYKLQKGLKAALGKLQDMQLAEGGFPWFKGDRSDRYITQYIIAGLGRLQKLGVQDNTGIAQELISKAIPYLDKEAQRTYDELIREKARMSDQHIGYSEVMYLYARSFTRPIAPAGNKAYSYFTGQAQKYWPSFNPYMKGLIALSLSRGGDATTPKTILQSLKETSSYSEALGRYWKDMPGSWWWYEAPIEAQSALVEAFSEVGNDVSTVNELKRWLLKNKQTTNWHSTRATADACYALLLAGSDWLSATPEVTVQLGDKTIKNTVLKTQSGTGHFKVHYDGKDVQPQMGNITLNVAASANPPASNASQQMPSWGAVYWQYFEDFDKITSAATPLALKRQIFKEVATDRGQQLEELKDGNNLKVGDKVTIRVVLQSDRDMEYLHLKDARAACFEPIDVISGYRYQDGLGYYQSTRDASSNFFISYLRKGTYVFTYSAHVAAKGNCSAGISTVQCMYAPEFSAHSEGLRVKVD